MDEIKQNEIEVNQEQLPKEIDTLPLEESTKNVVEQIIKEQDIEKVKDLTTLFNLNQVKKNLLRIVKMNNLLDLVQDKAIERIEQRPDEITHKELLDYMQVVQNSIDKSTKAIESMDAMPLVQINNTTNEIKVSMENTLDKDSRDKVLDVVQKLINIAKNESKQPMIETPEEPIIVELDNDEKEEED